MVHSLDNPVWHSLTSAHAHLAIGRGRARHYPRDITPFSAIAEPTEAAYADLGADLRCRLEARLFRPTEEPEPPGWETTSTRSIIQMLADTLPSQPDSWRDDPLVLGESDAKEMTELAGLAKPGPFSPRTYMLGRFIGFRVGGRLVAMGGERFRLPGFVELSAIAVHPEFRSAGLGTAVTVHLARAVLARGEIPFLHVFPDNPARELYQRLGFRERACLQVVWRRIAAEKR